jgi:murein DD-endopeptidase MepM/ murein hydrolase activator NlpD
MSGVPTRPARVLIAAAIVLLAAFVGSASVDAQEGPPDSTTTTTMPSSSTSVDPSSTTTTGTGSTTTVSGSSTTTTTEPDPDEPGPDTEDTDQQALLDLIAGYDEAVALEAELLAQFELSMSQIEQLNASMVALSETISRVEADLLDAETDLVQAEDRVDLAEVRLEAVEAELADQQEVLEEQAIAAYISGGTDPGVYALLSADTTHELESAMAYADAVSEHADDAVERFVELQVEATSLREEAEDAEQDAEEALEEVEDQRDALDSERERQARAQADAFVAALAQQGLIDEIEAQRGSYEERLRTLTGSSDSIENILRESQEGQHLLDDRDGIFLPPVVDPEITSAFGPRIHPIFGSVRMHNGLDIDGEMGTPLRAAEAGTVVVAGWQGGYGNTVVIDHGNGLATLYGHQAAIIVREGEEVEMGDTIGLLGSTGWSTGPHVHWEVRVFGNPTDPITYIGGEDLLRLAAAEDDQDD